MSEFILTCAGVIIGVLTAIYSVVDDKSKSQKSRVVLILLAVLGLAVGIWGAIQQRAERRQADINEAAAKQNLQNIQSKVGDVAVLDTLIQSKVDNLTVLDKLGDGRYYVVIATFQNNEASKKDFEKIKHNLLTLFPKAESNGLLWTHPVSGQQYELRLGRNLTPSSAEVFRRLATYGLANGSPII